MIFALLPVKALRNAKQRLSGILSPSQREALAFAMYQQVLATVCKVDRLARVVVVSSDDKVARHAFRCGVDVFEEREQVNHSTSADAAARRAISLGATTVLLLPIDVPLLSSGEIEHLIADLEYGVRIVPSADGSGTNALVRTPPDVIDSCFGPMSFRAHRRQARARRIPLEVVRVPGLMFDLDTPEDVSTLLTTAPNCLVATLLRSQWKSE